MPRNTRHGIDEQTHGGPTSMRPRQACLGIRAWLSAAREWAQLTSMRPRQACLGILATDLRRHHEDHNFNEAEASLPRNTLHSRAHHPDARHFNEAEASLPRNTAGAALDWMDERWTSMRPRQACLGIQLMVALGNAGLGTSMRPRQACLGILMKSRW